MKPPRPEKHDILCKVRFLYGQSSGQTTTDQEDGEFRWRHNLSSRVFSQSDTTFDSDKIRQINYEYQEDVGLGYKILSSARQTVDAGASAILQELGAVGVQHGIACFGSVFQDYTYKISGRYTLSENTSAQYSPQERSRYGFIANTNIALSHPLVSAISLRKGGSNESFPLSPFRHKSRSPELFSGAALRVKWRETPGLGSIRALGRRRR